MAEVELPSNSHKSKINEEKEEVKKVVPKKVVEGSVRTKKPSAIRKVASEIITEDASSIKDHIIWDVAVPYLKDMLRNIGMSAVDSIFGGGGYSCYNSKNNVPGSRYNYNKVSSGFRDDPKRDYRRSGRRDDYSYEDIILDSRADAERVLDTIDDIIAEYSMATVGDLYECVGVTPKFTDQKYGWTNIRGARVESAYGGGWIIRMPKALPLD